MDVQTIENLFYVCAFLANGVGLLAGAVTAFIALPDRPTWAAWLLAALFNAPGAIVLYAFLIQRWSFSGVFAAGAAVVSMFAVLFFGLGGFGVGWLAAVAFLAIRRRYAKT